MAVVTTTATDDGGFPAVIRQIWEQATTATAPPTTRTVISTAAVALIVVSVPTVWRVARHAITIAHEGGHALTALITGRRLSGIRLHSDTSGLTVSRGKPRGLGMILTAFMGYVGPGLIGLGAAALLSRGYGVGLLWLLIAALALMLIQIRNLFGLWSMLVCGGLLVAATWWLDAEALGVIAAVLTWFLLFGAIRPVVELQTERRAGRARSSDADLLARLTHLPGLLWVGVFMAITIGAAVMGGIWIWTARS